jgi:hypothetical protein
MAAPTSARLAPSSFKLASGFFSASVSCSLLMLMPPPLLLLVRR